MKFGAGADDDPFVKAKVQRTSASQKQTSCLNLTGRLEWISLDKDTFQIELQCMYAQMINICSPVQEETIEREDPSKASNRV